MKEKLLEILGKSDCLNIRGEGDKVWIERGSMYNAPDISFAILKQLSEFFGTDDIRVETFGYPGCDTYDYGSKYGHNIEFKAVNRNGDINGKFGTDQK